MPTLRRSLGVLPLRWKILIPFALLALAYGASATYVFSRAAAAEELADVTARLRDATTVTAASFGRRHDALVATARLIARTEGVSRALERGDSDRLARLVAPPALNAGHAVVLVLDESGAPLLAVERTGGDARVLTGGRVPGLEPPGVLAGRDMRGGVVRAGDARYLVATAPILPAAGEAVGTVVAGDALENLLRELSGLTRARLSLSDARGVLLAGDAAVPRPSGTGDVAQFRGRLGSEPARFVRVPVTVEGQAIGSLTVGMTFGAGLGALGDEAWKIAFLVVAVLAGVYLVGFGVARRVSDPLRTLLDGTRALQHGRLDHRVDLERADEFGELASSFNAMAEDIESSRRELERRVEERTTELREALERLDETNTELERASNAKTAFLANVSHELRTPLSGILLASEMIRDPRYASLPEERRARLLATVERNGRHLLALIDDLLDLSKVEAGHLDLFRAPVQLDALLTDVAETIGPTARDKGVSLEVPADSGLWVDVDPVRARQVLINLLSNAVKFTAAGGRVWVMTRASQQVVALAVHDTGIGIRVKDLARIFEPFEQVTARSQGTGLGLAITKRLVELHGGRLRVRSKPGEGSVFTATFTRAEPQGAAGGSPAAPARARRRGKRARVLVVEDDPTLLALTSDVLEEAGYRVEQAVAVDEALEQVRGSRPDVVLLDLGLGGSDGLRVVRGMRSSERTAAIPVLAVSAHARPQDVDRALSAGCTDYLTKPVDAGVLLERVGHALGADRTPGAPNGRRRT